MCEREETKAAEYFKPLLGVMIVGKLTDAYMCPRCLRTGMPRRISFDYYTIENLEDVPVFARNFCTRCVQDETTDDEYRLHFYEAPEPTKSEQRVVQDAPWRGYGALLLGF
jgi:hypothetical protein